jgi:hypothetical protein
MAEVGEDNGRRFLEQDLLAPLLKARQEKACARGDGPKQAMRVQKLDAALNEGK